METITKAATAQAGDSSQAFFADGQVRPHGAAIKSKN